MEEAKIRKIRTRPYHPEGNAQLEQFNRTLLNMLGAMPPNAKNEWEEWVSSMTHAYNFTISKTTGFSPYNLMFGRVLLCQFSLAWYLAYAASLGRGSPPYQLDTRPLRLA